MFFLRDLKEKKHPHLCKIQTYHECLRVRKSYYSFLPQLFYVKNPLYYFRTSLEAQRSENLRTYQSQRLRNT